MAFLEQEEKELSFVYPDGLGFPGSTLNEVAIHAKYIEKISEHVADENMQKAILCLFAWGYYGANKLSANSKGIVVKIEGEERNLSVILDLKKEKQGENDPAILTASKLARIGVGYAFRQGGIEKHRASPVWKKCPSWRNENEKIYLQIHGHLIPLRFPKMKMKDKVACIAINAAMQFVSAKGEFRDSAMKRISAVCRVANIPESSVSDHIKKTIGATIIGGPTGVINSYLTSLLYKEKEKSPKKGKKSDKKKKKVEPIKVDKKGKQALVRHAKALDEEEEGEEEEEEEDDDASNGESDEE
jgi:hypothetical protein